MPSATFEVFYSNAQSAFRTCTCLHSTRCPCIRACKSAQPSSSSTVHPCRTYLLAGDLVAWVDGQQPTQTHLRTYLQRVDTCVSELAAFLPELKSITNRSEAMCTCYPGSGTRYTRHCDNPNRNGRKLTALLYLNETWRPGDGGELRVCHPQPDETRAKAELAPLAGARGQAGRAHEIVCMAWSVGGGAYLSACLARPQIGSCSLLRD
jgi:hypothetical protein